MENQEDTEKVSPVILLTHIGSYERHSHLDAVRAIAFHPTELCLVTGGDDCTVKIWRTDVSGLASSKCVACSRSVFKLTLS
jgi:WD40 repeat protein